MEESSAVEAIEVLARRIELLDLLREKQAHKAELVDTLEQSRSTIDRAIAALEDAGYVERTQAGYRTTLVGLAAAERYRQFVSEQLSILNARDVLAPLPAEFDLPVDVLTGGRTEVVEDATELLTTLETRISDADRYRALLPTLADSRHFRLCHDGAVRGALEVELIAPPVLLDRLGEEFPTLSSELVEYGDATVLAADEPPFALLLCESDASSEGVDSAILVTYHDEEPRGVIVLTEEQGIDWAREYYESVRTDAHDATGELVGDDAPALDLPSFGRQRLPAQLRTEGFVRVDERLFDRREPMDPATAWQVGVGLPEVAAGYSIERRVTEIGRDSRADDSGDGDDRHRAGEPGVVPDDDREEEADEDEVDDEDGNGTSVAEDHRSGANGSPETADSTEIEVSQRTVADAALDVLDGGASVALLGPPGSGKSTIAKRIAYRWMEQRGQVLYRESGQGQPLTAIGALGHVLEAAGEPILVVVEDAMRAAAIFALMEQYEGDEDVSFLVDAREGEWRDPEEFPNDARLRAYRQQAITRWRVPPPDEAACRRFLEEMAAILDEPLDIDVDAQLAALRDEADEETELPPGSMFLLCSRIGRIVDPLPAIDGERTPTTLDADVDQLRADLQAIDELALETGVLFNLLNAAGCELVPEYAYALVAGGTPADRSGSESRNSGERASRPNDPVDRKDRATIRRALDRLEGHVLVPTEAAGTPHRTIHATWSVRFLERLLETNAGVAEEYFGQCVTALLSLADDRARREAILAERSSTATRPELAEDPDGWAERIAESIFRLGVEFAQLAPYFGTSKETAIVLPDACSTATRLACVAKRGRMFQRNGQLDRAIQEYETIEASVGTDADPTSERLLAESHHRRGDLYRIQGRLDAAQSQCRQGIEVATGIDDERIEAQCRYVLGVISSDRMDYRRAIDHYERALSIARGLEDAKLEAQTLLLAAQSLYKPGVEDLEGAVQWLKRALERYRVVGSRAGMAVARQQLGRMKVRLPRFDDEAAAELRTALELTRQIGQRRVEAWTLADLAYLRYTGRDLDAARSYYERAIDMAVDNEQLALANEARCELGRVLAFSGRLDRALEQARSEFDRVQEAEQWYEVLWGRRELALVHLLAGRFDEAIAAGEAALELADDQEITPPYQCLYWLGRAQCLAGDLDGAGETVERLADREPWVDPSGSGLAAQERYFRGDFEAAVAAARTEIDARAVDTLGLVWPLVLARVALELDELDVAERTLDRLLAFEGTPQYPYWAQLALIDRARLHRRRGDLDAAEQDLAAARERADEYGFRLASARARLQLGALARDRDPAAIDTQQLAGVIATLDELGAPFYAARARRERGLCLCEHGEIVEARASLTTAVEQFETLGAEYETARTLAILADVCEQLGDEAAADRARDRRAACGRSYRISRDDLRLSDQWPAASPDRS